MNRAAVVARIAELHGRTHVRRAVAHYRHASRLLDTPGSRRSRGGLDWANFFIADVQTGFGTFVAFYLANLGWTEAKLVSCWRLRDLPAFSRWSREAPQPTR